MIRCFIIDDEPHAIEVLSRYVLKTPGLVLAGSEENPLVALDVITSAQVTPELVFMDVDMPQLSGVDLAGLIQPLTNVVFTTAYPEYAWQAFEKNAVDYLLKPITYGRFLKSIHKIRERRPVASICENAREKESYFFVKSDIKGKLVRVNMQEILFIEALQNYVRIHVKNGQFITYLTMKEMEENLPPEQFSRVHKSFIVQNSQVKAVEGNQIILTDNKVITLGATFRDSFLGKINLKLIKSRRLP